MSTATDLQERIKGTRTFRDAFAISAILNAVVLAVLAATGSLLALAAAAGVAFCVLMTVRNTRLTGSLRLRERELNRPRMTPEDYRQLREMEIELGWEPSEVPASVAELAPGFTPPPALTLPVTDTTTMADFELGVARLYATLGTLYGTLGMPPAPEAEQAEPPSSAPMTGPGGRWRPVSELPEVKAAIAAAHFAELANVGRESCIGFCLICQDFDRNAREAEPLPPQARLPAASRECTIATMEPGRTYWTVPWAMQADEDGRMWLRPGYTAWKCPGGTAAMRIELREDGHHVWPVRHHGYTLEPLGTQQFIPVAVLEGEL